MEKNRGAEEEAGEHDESQSPWFDADQTEATMVGVKRGAGGAMHQKQGDGERREGDDGHSRSF